MYFPLQYILTAQSVIHGPAISVSTGSLLEMQNLESFPSPTKSESAF